MDTYIRVRLNCIAHAYITMTARLRSVVGPGFEKIFSAFAPTPVCVNPTVHKPKKRTRIKATEVRLHTKLVLESIFKHV